MIYFINMTQVENINPKWGANFRATTAVGEDMLLATIRDISDGFIMGNETMVADVNLYLAASTVIPSAEYLVNYGDYRLTISPAEESEYPWIVEQFAQAAA